MSEFKREIRYQVIKLKTGNPVDCVVVEADWPEYEIVWKMIQDRVEGRPNELETLRQQLAEAQDEIQRLTNIIQIPEIGSDKPKPVLCESCKAIGAAYSIGLEAATVQGEPVAWAIHVEGDTDSEITWDSIWDHPQFANDHINQQYELQADGYLPKCKRSVVPLYTNPAPSTDMTGMGYLNDIRAIVGGLDFPDMVRKISDLQSRLDARGEAYRIDYDEEMDRYYIPVHANWEIQTKGKGSSFRIANRKTGDRWLVGDSYLHEMLEQMARDIATYTQPTYLKGVAAGLRKAAEVCEANKNVVAKSNPARIEIKCCTENNMVDRCICSILAIKPEEV